METDRIDELERAIKALVARIEAQKVDLGALLRDPGPVLMPAPTSSNAPPSIKTTTRARNVR
jgi:hypothetical protein